MDLRVSQYSLWTLPTRRLSKRRFGCAYPHLLPPQWDSTKNILGLREGPRHRAKLLHDILSTPCELDNSTIVPRLLPSRVLTPSPLAWTFFAFGGHGRTKDEHEKLFVRVENKDPGGLFSF